MIGFWTPHQEIIHNYVAGDFGKLYLADGTALDVVGMREVCILLPNGLDRRALV